MVDKHRQIEFSELKASEFDKAFELLRSLVPC